MARKERTSDQIFDLPATLYDGMPMGRGVIRRWIISTSGTDTTLTHGLLRVPTLIVPLDNGTAFMPKWRRSTSTPWTATQLTIQTDVGCPAPGCFFWVL